jgi:hypothetical protein
MNMLGFKVKNVLRRKDTGMGSLSLGGIETLGDLLVHGLIVVLFISLS